MAEDKNKKNSEQLNDAQLSEVNGGDRLTGPGWLRRDA
ncbi:hypothetical protein SAMN05216463_10516 [Xylanibacter ruminicola]|uniref:Uncharacterized protein n=1 Tax=Xylanibacter ruminicola TaxID=839 RepID=A0A1M6T5E6_XYLRU|nr:hypothetical protein SAMN05216463_10516 [Xylanibacter ruminicola]